MQASIAPISLQWHARSKVLELHYANQQRFTLSGEFLRVYSPSAELRGHSPEQAVLPYGKRDVGVKNIERVGHYAVRLSFDDGHDSGIYSWEYLHYLCHHHTTLWQAYLDKLDRAAKSRDPAVQVLRLP